MYTIVAGANVVLVKLKLIDACGEGLDEAPPTAPAGVTTGAGQVNVVPGGTDEGVALSATPLHRL